MAVEFGIAPATVHRLAIPARAAQTGLGDEAAN
jgi:hypothetical protein